MNNIYNENLYNKAQTHHKLMCSKYSKESAQSIVDSKVYRGENFELFEYDNVDGSLPEVIFVKNGTVDALMEYPNDKWCVLNFASFRHPGGGYLKGAKAQEEMLCHESNLYNIIGDTKFANEYKVNQGIQNNGIYTDFAIYSPNVVFHRDNTEVKADVITCAAPNWKEIKKTIDQVDFSQRSKKFNTLAILNANTLRRRAEFVFNIAIENNCDNLILGAWGCGVFQQDAKDLAIIFKDFLKLYTFKKVIIAIPDDKNFNRFMEGWNR